jgi:two-component system, LytTR family, sensor kinase
MKVRWREHEMMLVTISSAIILAGYLWAMHQVSPAQFATPFLNNHTDFNFYRNVLLPNIGMGLLIFLVYLWLSLYTIPRLLFPKKIEAGTSQISVSFKKVSFRGLAGKSIKKVGWLFVQSTIIIFLVGTALNIATYYEHQWMFNYPGFSFLPTTGYNPNSQINISSSYAGVFFIMVLYAVYVAAREIIIHSIGALDSRRNYRILITNQLTAFLVVYVTISVFAAIFRLVHEGAVMAAWYSFVLPVFLLFMTSTYWLFPSKKSASFLSFKMIFRLLLSTFVCTLPSLVTPFHEQTGLSFIAFWAVQICVVTPVTWLLYQQQKDKILQLRGAEKALVRSRADLQFLRSQINPHFLFNVLNTLYGTALQENAERTAGGIQKLGDMMRFMLHENNLDFIQMSKEIDYLKNYIALQKLRTVATPTVHIDADINDQECHHTIAPMLLIPFVENAFKHGISLKEPSWIKIYLTCNEKNILFEVRNSMHIRQGVDPEQERSGIGFKNVLERLKLIYPGKHNISFNGDGMEFFVRLSIQP